MADSEYSKQEVTDMGTTEKAILAGGCFWGMQDLIRKRPGVLSTRVGYSGGDVPDATYRNHGTHAEAIEIVFDPEQTSYRDVLEFFFQIHDPTTLNRQGNDVGTQYRSVIFYHNEGQKKLAEKYKRKLDASGAFKAPIVTEIAPFSAFYPAEEKHQNFFTNNPTHGYCAALIRPKVEKFTKAFKDKVRTGGGR